MARRVVQLVALAAAVAVAIGAGTVVRHRVAADDPVQVAEAATRAFAAGDCAALRKISRYPEDVDCRAVDEVRDAYRDEGLDPDTFRYEIANSDDRSASVRITYERGDEPAEEIVELERSEDGWKVLPVPLAG